MFTSLVGVSLALLGNWNPIQSHFFFKIVFFVIISIVNICHIVYCAALDSKDSLIIDMLQKQIKTYQNALSRIIQICKYNADGINECIHNLYTTGKIDFTIWNYKKACYNVCNNLFAFLVELTNNRDIEVTYVKLNEEKDGEICLFAYSNKNNQKPGMLNVPRYYNDPSGKIYYDSQRFIENNSETRVLFGSEEINNMFYRTSEEKQKYPLKYNQFISIPVFCGDSKMIGLLQVAFFEKCSIASDKEVLKELADQLVFPYANLFLLLHKIHKINIEMNRRIQSRG